MGAGVTFAYKTWKNSWKSSWQSSWGVAPVPAPAPAPPPAPVPAGRGGASNAPEPPVVEPTRPFVAVGGGWIGGPEKQPKPKKIAMPRAKPKKPKPVRVSANTSPGLVAVGPAAESPPTRHRMTPAALLAADLDVIEALLSSL